MSSINSGEAWFNHACVIWINLFCRISPAVVAQLVIWGLKTCGLCTSICWLSFDYMDTSGAVFALIFTVPNKLSQQFLPLLVGPRSDHNHQDKIWWLCLRVCSTNIFQILRQNLERFLKNRIRKLVIVEDLGVGKPAMSTVRVKY